METLIQICLKSYGKYYLVLSSHYDYSYKYLGISFIMLGKTKNTFYNNPFSWHRCRVPLLDVCLICKKTLRKIYLPMCIYNLLGMYFGEFCIFRPPSCMAGRSLNPTLDISPNFVKSIQSPFVKSIQSPFFLFFIYLKRCNSFSTISFAFCLYKKRRNFFSGQF